MSFCRSFLILLSFSVFSLPFRAQTSLDRSDRQTATLISPYYFGPNAFPVPEMLDGTVSPNLRVEADVEHYFGNRGDHTTDIFLKLNIPLFSRRVNLSAWMTAVEWYKNSDENIKACRLEETLTEHPEYASEIRSGHQFGDVYVSADIQLLTEKRIRPDWTVRAVLKTASSDGYHLARFYDSPGYFFDTSLGKSFVLGASKKHTIRVALSTGFLCWQTDNGRQNDAIMYGILARWQYAGFSLTGNFSGYSGWEHNASNLGDIAHDQPMVVRGILGYRYKDFEFKAQYQYGVNDYPYHQIRVGAAYNIDILDKIAKRKQKKQTAQ